MSIPIFNKTQLNKQKLQNLNQAYTRISYIQIQCKPFLSKLQKKIIDPIFISEKLPFHCMVEENPFVPSEFLNKHAKVISPKKDGKYVVFPSGEFFLVWNPEYTELPTNEKLKAIEAGWTSSNINIAINGENDLIIISKKLFVIEKPIYESVANTLMNQFLGDQYK